MHGNELRKAGHVTAGIVRLRQSLQIDDHLARRGAGLVLLARAAARLGDEDPHVIFIMVKSKSRTGTVVIGASPTQ
jgi:hypothetical protein